MSQSYAITAWKAWSALGCINRRVQAGSGGEEGWSQYRKVVEHLETVQRRTTEMIRRLEQLSYTDRVRELSLLSLE